MTIFRACELFREARARLSGAANDVIDEVLSIRPIDPLTATATQAWQVIWDRPLWANARVAVAERWIEQLRPFMTEAWRSWGRSPDNFQIIKGPNSKYEGFGNQFDQVRKVSTASLHRLYAIQEAANYLREQEKKGGKPVIHFFKEPLHTLVPDLVVGLGWGWGPTSVVHMLTDFGVACKTDLHLLNSMRYLLVWRSSKSVTNLRETLAVNRVFRKMASILDQDTPQGRRRLDLELFHLSHSGVVPRA